MPFHGALVITDLLDEKFIEHVLGRQQQHAIRAVEITREHHAAFQFLAAQAPLQDGFAGDTTDQLAESVGNGRVEPKGNAVLITKQASGSAKIDPLMSLFTAVDVMAQAPVAERSFWETEATA